MTIRIISAVSLNGIIGVDNKIPWDYPEDMKFFRTSTANSVVIMGRKTYDSIGRPLPKRRNIVVSRNMQPVEGIEIASSTKHALDMCENESRDIWLIGGESVYAEGMEFADEIFLTMIPKWVDTENTKSVARFPWINPQLFTINISENVKLSEELTVIKYVR